MTESLSEIIKRIEKTNSWFEILKPDDLRKLLEASAEIYSSYLIPRIINLAGEDGGGYKEKDGLDVLSKIMKNYDKIEGNIKKIIKINKFTSTFSLFVILPIIPVIIFLIFLFFEKEVLILKLFPSYFLSEIIFQLNFFRVLGMVYLAFVLIMIVYRVIAKFLMDEVLTLAVQYQFSKVDPGKENKKSKKKKYSDVSDEQNNDYISDEKELLEGNISKYE
jgi:hypothetical protein